DELRQSPGGCADLIGQINIQVGDPVLQAIVSAMRYDLAGIGNTLTLSNLIDEVKAKLGAEEPWNERIAQAHQLVVDAKNAFPPPPTLQKVGEGKAGMQAQIHAMLMTEPALAGAVERAGTLKARDFARTVSLISG